MAVACLECLASPTKIVLASRMPGTHIDHPRRWRTRSSRRPCAAPACSPERSNDTSRHPPSINFDVSTQHIARSPRHLSYLFLARVCGLNAPVLRQTCTSDAPTRQPDRLCPGYLVSCLHVRQRPLRLPTLSVVCTSLHFRICKCRRRNVLSRGCHILTVHPRVGVGEDLHRYNSVPPSPPS